MAKVYIILDVRFVLAEDTHCKAGVLLMYSQIFSSELCSSAVLV